MYNPGKNRNFVNFYSRGEFEEYKDDFGQTHQKHKLICREWIEIIPINGKEFLQNRKYESEMDYRLRLRKREDISTSDYVVIDGKKCEIIYISKFSNYMEMVVSWQI